MVVVMESVLSTVDPYTNGCISIGEYVALEVERDVDGLAVPLRFAAPDSLVVLFQAADIRKALRFETGFRLAFGDTVCTRDGSGNISIVAFGRFDRRIDRSRGGGSFGAITSRCRLRRSRSRRLSRRSLSCRGLGWLGRW